MQVQCRRRNLHHTIVLCSSHPRPPFNPLNITPSVEHVRVVCYSGRGVHVIGCEEVGGWVESGDQRGGTDQGVLCTNECMGAHATPAPAIQEDTCLFSTACLRVCHQFLDDTRSGKRVEWRGFQVVRRPQRTRSFPVHPLSPSPTEFHLHHPNQSIQGLPIDDGRRGSGGESTYAGA